MKMSRNISSWLQLSLQVGNKDLDLEGLLPLAEFGWHAFMVHLRAHCRQQCVVLLKEIPLPKGPSGCVPACHVAAPVKFPSAILSRSMT